MSTRHLLALALLIVGCHRPAATTTPAATAEDPYALLSSVARGERDLLSLTEAGRGFAYTVYREDATGEDPRADEEGVIRFTVRVCAPGDVVSGLGIRIRDHVRDLYEGVPLTCAGLVCDARGPMEFATSLRFVFAQAEGGALVLRSVFEVEDVATIEQIAAQRWQEAEQAVADLGPECP